MKFYKVTGSKKVSLFDSADRNPKVVTYIPNGATVKVLDEEIYYRDSVKNEPLVKIKYKTHEGYIAHDCIT